VCGGDRIEKSKRNKNKHKAAARTGVAHPRSARPGESIDRSVVVTTVTSCRPERRAAGGRWWAARLTLGWAAEKGWEERI
jgi:hypothetical protein